jgi:hypothetical protein
MVESRQLVAHVLTAYLAANGVNAGGAERLQQQQTQPVSYLRQPQGVRQLPTPVRGRRFQSGEGWHSRGSRRFRQKIYCEPSSL